VELGSSTAAGSRRRVDRRGLRALNIAVTLVLAVFWWNLYRPQLLGGPAGYAVVEGTSMRPTLVAGDLVITREHARYHSGEVIAYRVPAGASLAGLPVIHRIVGGSASMGYVTKGDNRATADPWRVAPGDVIGSVGLRIPYAGTIVGVLRQPPMFAWLVGSIVLTGFWALDRRRRARPVAA